MSTFESDDDRSPIEDEEREPSRGLFGSGKSLLRRLVTLLHRRAELFTTELEEEVTRLIGVLLWSFVGVQCAIIGLTFLAVTVLLFIPEGARPWAAAALAVLFLGIAAFGAVSIKKIIAAKSRPFDASLRELETDREHLKEKR
jgi:uncharacterized membrane protein YqjE